MAKLQKMYVMSIQELLCKQELIDYMFKCGAFWERISSDYSRKPEMVWNEYTFSTDGEKWYFNRPYYSNMTSRGGMTAQPARIALEFFIDETNPYSHLMDRYTYDELTEMITSEIPVMNKKNTG